MFRQPVEQAALTERDISEAFNLVASFFHLFQFSLMAAGRSSSHPNCNLQVSRKVILPAISTGATTPNGSKIEAIVRRILRRVTHSRSGGHLNSKTSVAVFHSMPNALSRLC
jgi:hypothetical protein